MQNIPPDPGRRGSVAILLRQGRFLVIRRAAGIVAPLAYCFPGGAIEGDESESAALEREIREELGVTVVPQRRVWESVTPWQVRLYWWLADLPDDAQLRPNPAEVESIVWCSPSEMAALPGLLESNVHFLASLARGEIVLDTTSPRQTYSEGIPARILFGNSHVGGGWIC